MEQAKAVINLREGVIHLEGPVTFVQRYIDIYRSTMKGLQGTPAGGTAREGRRTSVRSMSRKAKPVTCSSAVREEFEAGFFAEPTSIREVKQRLIEKGITCQAEAIRMALKRLYARGLVDTRKKGGLVRYYSKV